MCKGPTSLRSMSSTLREVHNICYKLLELGPANACAFNHQKTYPVRAKCTSHSTEPFKSVINKLSSTQCSHVIDHVCVKASNKWPQKGTFVGMKLDYAFQIASSPMRYSQHYIRKVAPKTGLMHPQFNITIVCAIHVHISETWYSRTCL